MTRNGIEYDLEKSPYTASIKTTSDELVLFFSSLLNLEKFGGRYDDYVKEIDKSLSKRFSVNFHLPLMGAVSLYRKVERRGFAIYSTNREKMLTEEDSFCL